MDFGSFVFTPDAVGGFVGAFLGAGAVLGLLASVLVTLVRAADN